MDKDSHLEPMKIVSENAKVSWRERAEAEFRGEGLDSSEFQEVPSPQAIKQMQSELQIQQIELRLQSEEICRLQSKLGPSQTPDAAKPFDNLMVIAREKAESRLIIQKELLELIATGVPLKESLAALALTIEKHLGDLSCSILLADENGLRLHHGAAPSLPEAYWRAIDGVAIGDSVGSCGTAAFRRELIVVEDICEDPLWIDFRELATQHSLRACWSTPIIDSCGQLLGTFAIYKNEPGRPSAEHLQFIELASQIAIIAISKERTEVALRTSERELQLVLNSIPGLVSRVDRDLRYQYVNGQYERAFGKPRELVVGRKISDVTGKELFEQGEPFYRQALAGRNVTFESCSVTKSGMTRSWFANLVPELDTDHGVVGFFMMAFDNSENKLAQAEREEALSLLQKIAREVPGFVYQYRLRPDGTSCFPYISERVREIYSIGPEDLRNDASRAIELHHPDDQERVIASILESARDLTPWSEEYRLRFDDGTVRWVFSNSIPEREPDGSTLWHGYLADVTERKLAESAFAMKTRLLESTGELAKVGGWELDLVSNHLSWTAETCRIHDLDADFEPSVDQAINFYAPEARPVIEAAVKAGIESGTPWNLELPLITAKGRHIWVHAKGFAAMENGNAVRLFGAFQDITVRKDAEVSRIALETQLRESQKLEAVGTLASGIAHDFNNILTIILANAELGRMGVVNGNQLAAKTSFEEIKKAGERARDLVKQIISFSRRQPTLLKPTKLGPVVEESVRLLRATLPSRVAIQTALADNVPLVRADSTLIQQAIVNLATNSMQAIQGRRGCIDIRLDTVLINDESIGSHPAILAIHTKQPGPLARLVVSDDGCGMDAETMNRIFEPFFTTKEVGKGTGLGLSVVHGIVRSHAGEILVNSEPGSGSTFTIYLPTEPSQMTCVSSLEAPSLSDADRSTADTSTEVNPRRLMNVHVLLIDDDVQVLQSVKFMLEKCGCRVSAYSNQLEAINVLRGDPTEFDLLLVDYNMPGMSGIEVTREVRLIVANLAVAITSGYIDDALRSQAVELGVRELIPKPCSMADLRKSVEQLVRREIGLV